MEPLTSDNWLLTALVFAPLAGALIMALIPEKEEDAQKQWAILTSLVSKSLI